jgi:hypothetical protein
MIVGIRNKAAQFHFWEYINWIFGTMHNNVCNIQYINTKQVRNYVDKYTLTRLHPQLTGIDERKYQ